MSHHYTRKLVVTCPGTRLAIPQTSFKLPAVLYPVCRVHASPHSTPLSITPIARRGNPGARCGVALWGLGDLVSLELSPYRNSLRRNSILNVRIFHRFCCCADGVPNHGRILSFEPAKLLNLQGVRSCFSNSSRDHALVCS